MSSLLLVGGCVVATLADLAGCGSTCRFRRTPPRSSSRRGSCFSWGRPFRVSPVEPGGPLEGAGIVQAVAHGVSQVMFQASIWTGLLFLVGIALSDWEHAVWVLLGSIVGMLVGSYHATAAARVLDPESLVERGLLENVALGLYGYNATLAAVALFLWRRSLIPPLLGMLLSVPAHRSPPDARAARPDGTVRPGDLAGSGVRLARSKISPGAGGHALLTRPRSLRRHFSCSFATRPYLWSLAHESVTARTRQAADLRGRPGRQGSQAARPEAERPRGDGTDHGRAHGNGSRRQDRSPRS